MPYRSQRIMMISTHGYVAAVPDLGKPDTGGQVVYVLELSKCLARMGFQVDILTRQFEDQPAEEVVADQVRLLRFPCGGPDFIPKETLCDSIPEWVDNVAAYCNRERLRYAFINSHYWDAGMAGQMLAERFLIPHLHTPHSLGAWKRDTMVGQPPEVYRAYNFDRRVGEEKTLYRNCQTLIATTLQQREILTGDEYQTPRDKVRVVPPGYDDTRFFPVSPSTRQAIKHDLGLSGRIVLALGRMARNKGYDLLIRAMQPVCERLDDAKLVLAAGSAEPNEDELGQLAALKKLAEELGLSDRILFLDHIPDEALADYYRAADVFALSSRYEPFGMTAVEAMACGTPTVVTTEGGLWELITWGVEALYANPHDTEAFGHSLLEVLQYPQVSEQLAKNGATKARAKFTWTGVAQQILMVCEDVEQHPMQAAQRKRLIVSDLDGTLLGDDEALARFADWVTQNRDDCALIYATGRTFESVAEQIATTPLPAPDAVISSVGTEIREYPTGDWAIPWPRILQPWSVEEVRRALADFPRLELQPEEFQSEYKVSYYLNDASLEEIDEIQNALKQHGIGFELIYSADTFLDVLPEGTSKGDAVRAVAQHWGIDDYHVIVCGDTGNDSTMFRHGFRGVVVGNAHDELKELVGPHVYLAQGHYAAGVLEGLKRWMPKG